MKGIRLLFAVLLASLGVRAAVADDASDIARAASRRNAPNTVTVGRQKSDVGAQKSQQSVNTVSRSVPNTADASGGRERSRTGAANVVARPANDTKTVAARTGTVGVVARTAVDVPRATVERTSGVSRAATVSRVERAADTNVARQSNRSRVATISRNAVSSADIMTRDRGKCRSVFYDCMDEFCAAKDAQLKRCACSARAREFASTKKNLSNVEDKLLDFSQRLLTVNMDAEDAAALNQATEGELAFATTDTSKSKQMLDEISKKLNTTFDNSSFDQGLNAISLSLNMDAAFDGLDSMAGASTTAKSGTALHAAALPVCREIAAEVCTPDELAIAEGGYQMLIEQDCNTVAKSYQAQVDTARTKVFESGALLDMSRLDIYQKRNSDDILTCKSKMLDMLTDSTVCGTDMGKCLDVTGQYIDPTTGAAFLTTDLAQLANLITRPSADQSWTSAPGNDRFVKYLNSKKKFLEPAMEHCQDIADTVWDMFVEDALSQIKIAQGRKLEEMRQSCTTLTAQCLDEAADSLAEFDSRALSVFGVAADMTVNAMCADVRNACTALLQTSDGSNDWATGVTGIMTDKTYETILSTCREVGRNCIVQACTSISGNFGLCENIDTSINRKSIINRRACWDQVVQCVASAGSDAIGRIMADQGRPAGANSGDMYATLYGDGFERSNEAVAAVGTEDADASTDVTTDKKMVYDICLADAAGGDIDWATCRLAEQIWGNCEFAPETQLSATDAHNKILVMEKDDANETLLSWFARNTGTNDMEDSCRDTSCPAGFRQDSDGTCIDSGSFTSDGIACRSGVGSQFYAVEGVTNCCLTRADVTKVDNKCIHGGIERKIANATYGQKPDGFPTAVYLPTDGLVYAYVKVGDVNYALVCVGGNVDEPSETLDGDYPNGQSVTCNGTWMLISADGYYMAPLEESDYVKNYYYKGEISTENTCTYNPTGGDPFNPAGSWDCDGTPTGWHIRYGTSDTSQ